MPHAKTCGDCVNFRNDADHLEQTFPGLSIMSSGRGAVRAADGLCSRHDLYLGSNAGCDDHEAKSPVRTLPRPRPNHLPVKFGVKLWRGAASLLRLTRPEALTDEPETLTPVIIQPGFTLIEAGTTEVARALPDRVRVRWRGPVRHLPYPIMSVRNRVPAGGPR